MVSSLLGAGVVSMYLERFNPGVLHCDPMLDRFDKCRLSEDSTAEGVLLGLFIASWYDMWMMLGVGAGADWGLWSELSTWMYCNEKKIHTI